MLDVLAYSFLDVLGARQAFDGGFDVRDIAQLGSRKMARADDARGSE